MRTLTAFALKLGEFARQQPVGMGALLVILLMALAAAFAPVIAPYDPVANDLSSMLGPPSAAHWMGGDLFGRDVLTRILFGARVALVVGFVSAFMGCTTGALIGTISAYAGGKIDLILQRLIDIMLAIPVIITVMIAIVILGRPKPGELDFNLILAIAIPMVPSVTRVVRAAALGIRNLPYIDAARAAGFSHARIVLRHMLPNIAAPYLIMLTAYIAQAILLEAALAFLGLGITEPKPDWGVMLSGATAAFYREAPWMILFPGLAISVTVFSFNLLGDALRDWLDPKFRT